MRKKFKLGSLKPGVVKTAKKIIDECIGGVLFLDEALIKE